MKKKKRKRKRKRKRKKEKKKKKKKKKKKNREELKLISNGIVYNRPNQSFNQEILRWPK